MAFVSLVSWFVSALLISVCDAATVSGVLLYLLYCAPTYIEKLQHYSTSLY